MMFQSSMGSCTHCTRANAFPGKNWLLEIADFRPMEYIESIDFHAVVFCVGKNTLFKFILGRYDYFLDHCSLELLHLNCQMKEQSVK